MVSDEEKSERTNRVGGERKGRTDLVDLRGEINEFEKSATLRRDQPEEGAPTDFVSYDDFDDIWSGVGLELVHPPSQLLEGSSRGNVVD